MSNNLYYEFAEYLSSSVTPDETDFAIDITKDYFKGGKSKTKLFKNQNFDLGGLGIIDSDTIFQFVLKAIECASPFLLKILLDKVALPKIKKLLLNGEKTQIKNESFIQTVTIMAKELKYVIKEEKERELIIGKIVLAHLEKPDESKKFVKKISSNSNR